MSSLFKILVTGLVLVCLLAVGTEVAALHQSGRPPAPARAAAPVVRKVSHAPQGAKSVQLLPVPASTSNHQSQRRSRHKPSLL